MSEDDWRNWKNGKYDNRYHGVKRHSGKSNSKPIIIISVVICAIIGGYFVFQTYGTPQAVQNEASDVIKNTGNTIQKISTEVSQQANTLNSTMGNTMMKQGSEQKLPYSVVYGASSRYSPSADIITLTVMGSTNGFSYNVIIKDYSGTVKHQYIETSNTSTDIRALSLSDVCKPAEVIVSVPDEGIIYSTYDGTFEQEQSCQK